MKWIQVVGIMVVMVTTVSSQTYTDWIQNVNKPYGESVTFNCTNVSDNEDEGHPRPTADGDRPWENTTILYWLAHLDRIENGQSIHDGNIEVSDYGDNLTIHNATTKDFLIYHCVMRSIFTDEIYMVKWGLNMRGPYFEDLWDKYRMNVIIGVSAMFGFLVVACFVILVYRFRWVDPETETDAKKQLPVYANEGFINGAYAGHKHDVIAAYNEKPEANDYEGMEMTSSEPAIVSVAEVHTNQDTSPAYTYTTPHIDPLPEPDDDTTRF